MSVAFRREGDDEHKEPTFEIPIPPGPNFVTPRGRSLIEAKLATLDAAIAAGDEEDALKALRREQRYWATRLATARVAVKPDEGEVGVGSRVTFCLNGAERTITIVGGDEADPANDLLAFTAPLARAMMEAFEGDRVDYAGVPDAIEILSVEQTV